MMKRGCGSSGRTEIITLAFTIVREGSVPSRIIAPRGHIFSNNKRRLPLHPYAGRVSISSHEWSMWRSESAVSSIVTVVDIVVVTRWFKFLTRDSCCQARRKRRSRFHATGTVCALLPSSFLLALFSSSFRVMIVSKDRYWRECHIHNPRVWVVRVYVFTFYKPNVDTLPNPF